MRTECCHCSRLSDSPEQRFLAQREHRLSRQCRLSASHGVCRTPSWSHFDSSYRYEVTYGRDAVPQALSLFNPLLIIGFPIGADTVVVTAKLEVLKESTQVKTYTAVCILDKHRTIFSEGETLSELRKRGLLAVRDNIETQMYGDRDLLLKSSRED